MELSLVERSVLGLLAEGPAHGFGLAASLAPGQEIGRFLTVRRPLVYRALDRLVAIGMAQRTHTEPGAAAPRRQIHAITARGRDETARWLAEPVAHIRDMRMAFQLKLALLQRSGQSPVGLIDAQVAALAPTVEAILHAPAEPTDGVALWRRHNAKAVMAYLQDLRAAHEGGRSRRRGGQRYAQGPGGE